MLKKLQPRSVLRLVLLGFAVVLLPLVLAIYNGVRALDTLAEQSRGTVMDVVQATRSSQAVQGALSNMERTARQYVLLGDAGFLKVFAQHHASLRQALDTLERVRPDSEPIFALRQGAEKLNALLSTLKPGRAHDEILSGFEDLTRHAERLASESSQLVDSKVASMQSTATTRQKDILAQSIALGPATALLVAMFTFLIAKPIRQLDHIISGIGDGRFTGPIELNGPDDLRAVGERLDWLRTRLAELEAEKQKFLRHMSHELKTPLAGLREGSDLLAEEIPGPLTEAQREVVSILQSNSRELQKLIENLLDYNVIHAGNLHISEFDVRELVGSVVSAHKLSANAKHLRLELQGETASLHADRGKLRTAIDNLIGNAVNFTPDGGLVSISWQKLADSFLLHVRDEGPGVALDEREHIFMPFYQGSAHRSGPVKGSGIGLSVARECIAAHGGHLELLDSVGTGACFRIQFPLDLGAKRVGA
ncbi:MAG: HAMP domain-containing histidine kinase [Gammaproteobacteria bacterium]|nr:HAMP domain-containing histidine kinase [Gammaproteobacteria bacterium]